MALTQISAYSPHKNLAVRKIMEALRTVCAERRDSVSTHSSILKGKRASFANILFR